MNLKIEQKLSGNRKARMAHRLKKVIPKLHWIWFRLFHQDQFSFFFSTNYGYLKMTWVWILASTLYLWGDNKMVWTSLISIKIMHVVQWDNHTSTKYIRKYNSYSFIQVFIIPNFSGVDSTGINLRECKWFPIGSPPLKLGEVKTCV